MSRTSWSGPMWVPDSELLHDWVYLLTFGLKNHGDFVAMNNLWICYFVNIFVPYFNIYSFVNLDFMCKGVLLSCLSPPPPVTRAWSLVTSCLHPNTTLAGRRPSTVWDRMWSLQSPEQVRRFRHLYSNFISGQCESCIIRQSRRNAIHFKSSWHMNHWRHGSNYYKAAHFKAQNM